MCLGLVRPFSRFAVFFCSNGCVLAELSTPMPPILRPPPDNIVIIDHVAVSQLSPSSARVSPASGTHHPAEVRMPPDYQRYSESCRSAVPIGPPRDPPLPPRRLTIDVGVSRAFRHTSHLSAGSPRSPYRGVPPSPGPTFLPQREPHFTAMQRTTERSRTLD